MLADDGEFERAMGRGEFGSDPQQVGISRIGIGPRHLRQLDAGRPFDLERRQSKKQRAGKMTLRPEPGLRNGLFAGQERHAFRVFRRRHAVLIFGIDRAGDRGTQAVERKA